MGKTLADVISELSGSGKTGILSVSVKNDTSLFKIFFRDGVIYHMTHGACRDMGCVAELAGLTLDAVFFMPGARIDIAAPLALSTNDIIKQIRNLGKDVSWGDRPVAQADAAPKKPLGDKTPDDALLKKIEEELLNIVGPVAPMVLDRAFGICSLKKGVPLKRPELNRLLEAVSLQLPEEQRKAFVTSFEG